MNIGQKLKECLMTRFNGKPTANGKNVVIPCQYCNDTGDHHHMYCEIPTGDNPARHHCFKCGASGLITHDKLISWGLAEEKELIVGIASYNKRVLSLAQNLKFKDQDIYYLSNYFISDNELSQAKLRYINKRLGQNLTYQDLLDNKVVLNLLDLLKSNRIKEFTRHPNIINELNESFLGFITVDNAFVNMRNLREGKVYKGIDQRYVNYNIFDKYDNTERIYVCPTKFDYSKKVELHLSEGSMDILSVKYNLRKNLDQTIYAANLGSSYFSTIKYFICKIGIVNMDIHIYIDKDINPNYFDTLINILYPYIDIHVFIHQNIKEGLDLFGKPIKDFGVPLEMIDERIFQLM